MKIHKRHPAALFGICLLFAASLFSAQSRAGGFLVNSTLDGSLAALSGNATCELREALDSASNNTASAECFDLVASPSVGSASEMDAIFFDSGLNGTIRLTAPLIINGGFLPDDDLTIFGPGTQNLSISGENAFRVFEFIEVGSPGSFDVDISGLTVQAGQTAAAGGCILSGANLRLDDISLDSCMSGANGGGVHQSSGDLLVRDSILRNNTAASGQGGAIFSDGAVAVVERSTLTGNMAGRGGAVAGFNPLIKVESSTLFSNTAGDEGGAIFVDTFAPQGLERVKQTHLPLAKDLPFPSGTAIGIANSTISGNSATNNGGGIATRDVDAVISNSTIVENVAANGGGLNLSGSSQNGHSFDSSIFANNTATMAASDEIAASLATISATFSLFETNFGVVNGTSTNNLSGVDPQLGPLAFNGGLTRTHLPASTSPVVDAGSNAPFGLVVDQRLFLRSLGAQTDIGAVEVVLSQIVVNSAADTVADDGMCTLREAITAANTNAPSGMSAGECSPQASGSDSIVFAISGAGPHIISPTSALPIISGTTLLDASTQAGADCVAGDLRIVLDGSLAGAGSNALAAQGFGTLIRGFVVQNFTGAGVILLPDDGGIKNAVLQCNFIGLGIDGESAGQNNIGIGMIDGAENTLVGGELAGEGNVISGNVIGLASIRSEGSRILGNKFGTNFSGTSAVGNGVGLLFSGDNGTQIGSENPNARNIIANSTAHGVQFSEDNGQPTSNVDMRNNRIENNAANGVLIELGSSLAANVDNCYLGNASVTGFGLNNTTTINTVAELNWWGDASGPGGTEPGSGDTVSTLVDAVPFRTTAPAGCLTAGAVDLTLTAAESSDPVVAGDANLSVVLTLTNNSAIAATNISLDLLPGLAAGVTVQSVNVSSGNFTGSTWTLPLLAAGGNATLTVDYSVAASAVGGSMISSQLSINNVDQPLADPMMASFTEVTSVTTAADLQVSMTDSPDPVVVGDPFSYIVTVTNIGPSDASGVVLSFSPTGQAMFVDTAGCFEDPNGLANCTVGNIPAGSSVNYSVNMIADIAGLGASSTAAVNIADTMLLNPGDDSATELTDILDQNTLYLTKADSVDPVLVGNVFNYTVTVFNTGPVTATNVQVTDTLPTELGFVSTNGCAEDPAAVPICSLGSIAPGARVSYDISVIAANLGGVPGSTIVSNTVSVTTSSANFVTIGAVESTVIDGGAFALNVSKQGAGDGVVQSAPVGIDCGASCSASFSSNTVVTLTGVANPGSVFAGFSGDQDCSDGIVTMDRPVNCIAEFATESTRLNILKTGAGGGLVVSNPRGIRCGEQCSAEFAGGERIVLVAVPDENSRFAGYSGPNGCPIAQINLIEDTTCTARFTQIPGADIDVSVVESVDPVLAGSGSPNLTHTFRVTNNGPVNATDVVITGFGTRDFGRTLVPSVGSIGMGLWTIPSLPVGASAQLQVAYTVGLDVPTTADAITSRALLFSVLPFDHVSRNNGAFATTSIAGEEAQLQVSKTDSADPVQQFEEFDYTITIHNAGPSTARDVLLNETLPDSLQFEAVSGCLGPLPHLPLCSLGDINPGDSKVVTVSVTPLLGGDVTNHVEVTATTPLLGSAEAQETTTVEPVVLNVQPLTLPDAQVGEGYMAAFSVSNGVPPDTFAINPAELPPGLSLVGDKLTGEPTTFGSFPFTVLATDSRGATGQRDYVLTVLPAGLFITTSAFVDGNLGAPYSQQLMGTGGIPAYDWAADDGLPPGLSIDPVTGVISGIPTLLGVYPVEITLMDSRGVAAGRSFVITIGDAFMANLTPPLPPGAVGVPYNAPFIIAGGIGDVSCALFAGQLPPGLDIEPGPGACSIGVGGTPTLAGSFAFDVLAEDSAGRQLVFPALIRVSDPVPSLVPSLNNLPPVNVPLPDLSSTPPGGGFAEEALQKAAVDSFGNTYLVGFSFRDGDYDIDLLKVAPDGTLLWRRRFDAGGQEFAYGVAVDPVSQNVYVVGYRLFGTEYRGLLLAYATDGSLQWEREVRSGFGVDAFYDVDTDDQRVCAAGESFNSRDFDGLITCYDHSGTRLWQSRRATTANETAYRVNMRECSGEPVAFGTCAVEVGGAFGPGLNQGWLLSLRPSDGAGTRTENIPAFPVEGMTLVHDGFVIGGTNAADDWRMRRLDNAGTTIWDTSFAAGDQLRSVEQDAFGYLFVTGRGAGIGGNDGLVVLLDPLTGINLDVLRFDEGVDERLFEGLVAPDNNLILAGQRTDASGITRFLLLFLDTGTGF